MSAPKTNIKLYTHQYMAGKFAVHARANKFRPYRNVDDLAEDFSSNNDCACYQATRNRFYYRGVLIWRVAGTDAEEHPIAAWDGDTSPYYEVNVRLSPFPHHSVHRFVTLKQAVYFLVHANLGKQIPLLQSEALPALRQGKGYNLKVIL